MSGRFVLAKLRLPCSSFAALGGAWLLLFGACGSEAPTAAPAQAPAAASAGLRFADGRVSLARDEVLQLALLEELAQAAGFELEVGAVAPRSISLRLDQVPLIDAIAAMLEGTAFRAEYAVDPKTGAHVLARLAVGEPAPTAPGPAGADSGGLPAAQREREARADKIHGLFAQRREASEERLRLARASIEERHARETEAIEQLADSDAAVRVEALATIDPAGDAAPRVAELARTDPDPRVRAAAVERLGDADTWQATSTLLESLVDPSPEVVIAALEALEYSGDHSLLPRVAPLANHPNPAVREAAKAAIESLE